MKLTRRGLFAMVAAIPLTVVTPMRTVKHGRYSPYRIIFGGARGAGKTHASLMHIAETTFGVTPGSPPKHWNCRSTITDI